MKIISRFKVKGDEYAYMLDDSGINYAVTERGLYDEDTLEGLTKDGYKILNYHGDVLTPEGINIKDMVEEPCTISESEIQCMLDMADYALSEAEAAKYFARDVQIKAIEMKAPKVEIKTREELCVYLDKCLHLSRMGNMLVQDVRPLNSFVAKEALFTMEELATNEKVREYFSIIARRRKLTSYNSYRELIKFLQSEGVLGEKYSTGDIKNAYLSWGICGLNTPIINMSTKIDATAPIDAENEAASSHSSLNGRVIEVCLMDKAGVIHYSGGKVDLSDSDDFTAEPVMPSNERQYYNALHSTSKWETPYMAIRCLVRKYKHRTYFELMDDNGVTYTAKVDVGTLFIRDARSTICYEEFLFIKGIDGSYINLERIKSEEDYKRYNLLMAKAREMVREKTTLVPVTNSFDLLLNEGVSPKSAIQYITRRIDEDSVLNADYKNGLDYRRAYELYQQGPSNKLIQKYNPNDLDYDTLDELIEIMCATRDEMEERQEYLVLAENSAGDEAEQTRDEIRLRPIENLEFVKRIKEGEISIDYLHNGKVADGTADLVIIADILNLVIRVETEGRKLNETEFTEWVDNIEENTTVINFDTVVRERSSAYKGYLKDKAKLNAARAVQSSIIAYVTRVFREQSNLPAGKQRHYMFECITMSLEANSREEKMLHKIADNISLAVDEQVNRDKETKELLKIEAPATAARLMFAIALKQIEVAGTNDVNIKKVDLVCRLDDNSAINLLVNVPADYVMYLQSGDCTKRQYCTLFDWCTCEMSSNLAFNLYCLNATITPWRVIPKKGVNLREYNFHLNYVSPVAISKLSQGFQEKIESEKAKVARIRETYFNNYLLDGDLLDVSIAYTEDTVDAVLSEECDESIANYYDRFRLHNEKAKENGEYLQRMRLKSDVVFENFTTVYGEELYSEDIYKPLSNTSLALLSLSETTPSTLSGVELDVSAMRAGDNIESMNTNIAIESGNKIDVFEMKQQTFKDVSRWTSLVNGTFIQQAVCIYSAGKLLVVTPDKKRTLDLRTLSMEDALKLVGENIFYQLSANKFLFEAMSKMMTLEVL